MSAAYDRLFYFLLGASLALSCSSIAVAVWITGDARKRIAFIFGMVLSYLSAIAFILAVSALIAKSLET